MSARRAADRSRGRLIALVACLTALSGGVCLSTEVVATPETCSSDSVCFVPLHVYVDPGGQPLA
ncbi:MAG: hypothetical protein MUE60_05890, partial [Candidatus Eisenbacteria bacterium]|nr:hypothetical protein [Candidatus Eisenbacteria bacterium]